MPADIILNSDDIEIVENVRLTRSKGRDHTILLESSNGNIYLGGDGRDGDLVLKDNDDQERIHLDAHHASPSSAHVRIYLDGRNGNLSLGGDDADGDVLLKDENGDVIVHIDAGSGNVYLGGSGKDGDVVLRDTIGKAVVHLDGGTGKASLGGAGKSGEIVLKDGDDIDRIQLVAKAGNDVSPKVRALVDGLRGRLILGGVGQGGSFDVLDATGSPVVSASPIGAVDCASLRAGQITLIGVGDLATKISKLEGGSPSDSRLKENVEPIEDSCFVIEHLDGVRFNWKAEGSSACRGEQVGLVAQQVAEVLPEAVSTDATGYLRVNYDSVVAVLVEALKAQQQKLGRLGERLSQLEDRAGRIDVMQ